MILSCCLFINNMHPYGHDIDSTDDFLWLSLSLFFYYLLKSLRAIEFCEKIVEEYFHDFLRVEKIFFADWPANCLKAFTLEYKKNKFTSCYQWMTELVEKGERNGVANKPRHEKLRLAAFVHEKVTFNHNANIYENDISISLSLIIQQTTDILQWKLQSYLNERHLSFFFE